MAEVSCLSVILSNHGMCLKCVYVEVVSTDVKTVFGRESSAFGFAAALYTYF